MNMSVRQAPLVVALERPGVFAEAFSRQRFGCLFPEQSRGIAFRLEQFAFGIYLAINIALDILHFDKAFAYFPTQLFQVCVKWPHFAFCPLHLWIQSGKTPQMPCC